MKPTDDHPDTVSTSRVRLVGELIAMGGDARTFTLKLDGGEEVAGVLLNGDMSPLANLLGKRALVLGRAVFHPSGQLWRVEADEVQSGEGELAFWSRMPVSRHRRITLEALTQPQGPDTGA